MIFSSRLSNLKISQFILFIFASDADVEPSRCQLCYFLLPSLKNVGFFYIDLVLNCHAFLLNLQVGGFFEFDCLPQL